MPVRIADRLSGVHGRAVAPRLREMPPINTMRTIFCCLLTLLLPACAMTVTHAPADHAAWVQAHGGLLNTPQQERLNAIAARLAAHTGHAAPRVQVLANRAPTAYSYPSGEIYVTSGLLALTCDDELAAALAHELGHLINDGHLRVAFALQGNDAVRDIESQADLTGCRLLQQCRIPPRAMAALLKKVEPASPQCLVELRRRQAVLERQFPTK